MKRLLFFIGLVVFSMSALAQLPFKVITVNGEIIATKAKLTLENGVEVFSDDNFEFRKPNSRAAMINSERGRVVLTEQNVADAFSRAAFAPAMSSVSARSGAVSSLAELQNIFSDKVLIIDKVELQVGPEYFPMEEQKFFFLRYMYKNERVNKRLAFKGDMLLIDMKEVLSVDGKPISESDASEFTLYYHKNIDGKPESVLISSFEPLFVSSEQVKPEIAIIVDEFKGADNEKILAEVYDYLSSFYGKVDRPNLEKWLKKEFNLNLK
jgi:hypothetical protein